MVKGLLESILREERAIDFEEHPSRPTVTPRRTSSPSSALWRPACPRVREGEFYPKILPYRHRTSLEHSEAILALYAAGVGTRAISRFLERNPWRLLLAPEHLPAHSGVEGEVRAWRERPLYEEYYAVFLGEPLLSIRRRKTGKEPVYIALGLKPHGCWETPGCSRWR